MAVIQQFASWFTVQMLSNTQVFKINQFYIMKSQDKRLLHVINIETWFRRHLDKDLEWKKAQLALFKVILDYSLVTNLWFGTLSYIADLGELQNLTFLNWNIKTASKNR